MQNYAVSKLGLQLARNICPDVNAMQSVNGGWYTSVEVHVCAHHGTICGQLAAPWSG